MSEAAVLATAKDIDLLCGPCTSTGKSRALPLVVDVTSEEQVQVRLYTAKCIHTYIDRYIIVFGTKFNLSSLTSLL